MDWQAVTLIAGIAAIAGFIGGIFAVTVNVEVSIEAIDSQADECL